MAWWRAYDESADDPKLQRLSADLFRALFNLVCLASRNGGVLPPRTGLVVIPAAGAPEGLTVQIDDYTAGARTLTRVLTGARRELTSGALAAVTFKYPLITLRTITLIHWHALRLWLKRVPWFAKASRPADQRALYRPHRSLQPSDVA
jgi:hypothetical protein